MSDLISTVDSNPVLSQYRESTPPPIKSDLGADSFFKLLAVQLSNQDPLKPMDDTAFIAQMAQFSSLEQMNSLNENFTKYSHDQQGLGYLGKEVTIEDKSDSKKSDNKEIIIGVVTSLQKTPNGETFVSVNDKLYNIKSIREVHMSKASPAA